MLKNMSYQEKFQLLTHWMEQIVDEVKKDLKNEHLKKDWVFLKKYFSSKNINKLTNEDLVQAYAQAIQHEEKGDAIGEFISTRWLLKNSDIYSYFEDRLKKVSPDFSEIELLEKEPSEKIINSSVSEFGAIKTYLFSVMNSVVFPEDIYKDLAKKAEQERSQEKEQAEEDLEKLSLEQLQKAHARELTRLMDKYEKKLSGMQRKYLVDVENLKKQISQLHRKLHETGS